MRKKKFLYYFFSFLCVSTSPEILKHEMKVFFVKYNDPIYVKLEKLDIMIRLASQANIAQVNKTHTHTPTLHLKHDLCLIHYVHTFLYYTTQ